MIWILTQDQKSFVRVKEVYAKENGVIGMMNKGFLANWGKYLGNYETDKRALAVVQDIFKKIEESNDISVTYQMPEN